MKKSFLILSSAMSVSLLASCGSYKGKVFYFPNGGTNDYKSQYFYSDDYFSEDASTYNPSLSTCSLSFAMASFASNRNGSDNNYNRRYRNGYDFLNQNGFKDIDVNKYYKEKPTTDSLGTIFAHKEIQGQTLVAVGIRGAGYESEWASNFTLGLGDKQKQAQGFYEASTIYLNSLEEYLNKYDIRGSIKLWTVGYSRAGATNNLASGRIDQMMKKDGCLFQNRIIIEKQNLFSYCFEPPQGASFLEDISPRDDMYSNIHNIVNDNDPVPKVAMSAFSYTRYGVDYYLPDSIRDLYFEEHLNKVISFYQDMDSKERIGSYCISNFSPAASSFYEFENPKTKINWTSGLFLSDFIDNLSKIGVKSLENYVSNIQNGIRDIFALVYKNGSPKTSMVSVGIHFVTQLLASANPDQIINNLIANTGQSIKEIIMVLYRTLTTLDIEIDSKKLTDSISSLILAITKTILLHTDYLFTLIKTENLKCFGAAHYPELCLAHLMAQDKNFNDNPFEYNSTGDVIYIKSSLPDDLSDVSMKVENSEGKIIAELSQKGLLQNSKICYGVDQNLLRIYLPVGQKYKITAKNTTFDVFLLTQKKENPVTLYSSENADSSFEIDSKSLAES